MSVITELRYLVVHHSASPLTWTLEKIRDLHVGHHGWSDVGYHWIIERDGAVRPGRPLWKMGAHCPPWNRKSWGVCVIGDNTTPVEGAGNWRSKDHGWTDAQLASLAKLVASVRMLVPTIQVVGHEEVGSTPTVCPGIDGGSLRMLVAPEEEA